MQTWRSPKQLLKATVKLCDPKLTRRVVSDKEKAAIRSELTQLPKQSQIGVKAKIIQTTNALRQIKMNVRRLTLTEVHQTDIRKGNLNDSFIESLQPAQTLVYKKLVIDYGIDESVAAFACLQTNFANVHGALEHLFEPFEHPNGKTVMAHPFIGYDPTLPNRINTKQRGDLRQEPYVDRLICFLCQRPCDQHLLEDDILKMQKQKQDEECLPSLELNIE